MDKKMKEMSDMSVQLLPKGVRGLLQGAMLFLFGGAGMATVLVQFADRHHYLELLSHFRAQYLMVLLGSGVVLALINARRWGIPVLGLVMLCGWPIIPYYRPPASIQTKGDAFKLLNANILAKNRNYEALSALIHRETPDIVALEEVTAEWAAGIKPAMRSYPYQVVIPLSNAFGIALYSKWPLSGTQVKYFGNAYRGRHFPSIVSHVHVGSNIITLVVAHPLPPMAGFSVRNSQLADLANQRKVLGNRLLVVGDLNMSPWSPYFQRFILQTGLRDSQLGFGIQPSWPAANPLVRIPIDHVLVSQQFVVLKRKLGPDIGSDHLPVIAELALK